MPSRAKLTDEAYDAALNAAREAQHAYDTADAYRYEWREEAAR